LGSATWPLKKFISAIQELYIELIKTNLIDMKTIKEIEKALEAWVIEFHQDGDDDFECTQDDFEFTGIYCEGPYTSDDEDGDGNQEVDENCILYVLSADIYLKKRIELIKAYKAEHGNLDGIEYDEANFPNEFHSYDNLMAWHYIKEGYVEFVPNLEDKDNKRFLENITAFINEYIE
jgi:hypothetical protein